MKRILLSVILLLALDFVCGCEHTRVEAGSGANKDDVLSLEPPSLKDASSLLEFHRCILAEIGKEMKVDWRCFYDDVL